MVSAWERALSPSEYIETQDIVIEGLQGLVLKLTIKLSSPDTSRLRLTTWTPKKRRTG
jgi:hypothetical protein